MKNFLYAVSSLYVTVFLLTISVLLVFAGTGAQVEMGTFDAQKRYFHTLFCYVDLRMLGHCLNLDTLFADPSSFFNTGFWMPGGYLIGLALLINLLAAQAVRYEYSVRKIGLLLTHAGVILLIIGEGISSQMQQESRMPIAEGSYANYSEDHRQPEITIVDVTSSADHNIQHSIGTALLEKGKRIEDKRLPFVIQIDELYRNAELRPVSSPTDKPVMNDVTGDLTVEKRPQVSGADASSDTPALFVTVLRDGNKIGSYLLTAWGGGYYAAHYVVVDGKTYELSLRARRFYVPFKVELIDFRFDRFAGTAMARNYSSQVKVVDSANNETREVHIKMNNPMRYRGTTYYQASFDPNSEKITFLQVVTNPAWQLPYLSIIIGTLGLLDYFMVGLMGFIQGRRLSTPECATVQGIVAAVFGLGAALYLYQGLNGLLLVVGLVVLTIKSMIVYRLMVHGRSAFGLRSALPATPLDRPTELTPAETHPVLSWLVPSGILLFGLLFIVPIAIPSLTAKDPAIRSFGATPIYYQGRLQPLDSMARNALKFMRGKESALLVEGTANQRKETNVKPVEWLLDAVTDPEADRYKVIRIDHSDIKTLLDLDNKEKYFSIRELASKWESKLLPQFNELHEAVRRNPKNLSDYQRALQELERKLMTYQRVVAKDTWLIIPPTIPGADWTPMHSHAPGHAHQAGEALSGTAQAFQAILDAHKTLTQFNKAQATAKTPEEKARVKEMASEQIKARKAFDKVVSTYAAGMTNHQSSAYFKTTFEFWYSRFSPFIWTMYIYIGSFLCTAMSWIFWRKPMARAGLWLLGLALFVHTFAIFARVYITGYAPVTNLASSAMWVAWGAAVFALFIELIFRNTLGLFIAAVVGVPSLLIAHYRGLGGDTMAQMEAVLDSNLWLTVHVLTITLGYSATFVAAAVGMAYLIVRLQPSFDPQIDRTYKNIMFGVTCFAMVFSFVGTITGGIWADQSWGRFWGWDPKENGAILVVLANAIFLHARLSGIAKGVGMANIAIASAMVTAWSWFGTNLMGAGLHAYGFFESGWLWLYIAWIEMAQYMLLGLLPAKNIEPPETQLPAPPPVHPGLRPSRYVTKVV